MFKVLFSLSSYIQAFNISRLSNAVAARSSVLIQISPSASIDHPVTTYSIVSRTRQCNLFRPFIIFHVRCHRSIVDFKRTSDTQAFQPPECSLYQSIDAEIAPRTSLEPRWSFVRLAVKRRVMKPTHPTELPTVLSAVP